MASNPDPPGVDFALSQQQQAVRLMELPPALLEAVENNETFQLKSQTQSPTSSAVLCTPTRTFTIRQNQSSNSLFITQTTALTNPTDVPPTSSPTSPALLTIAQPSGMLELTPCTPDTTTHLHAVLPIASLSHHHPSSSSSLPGSHPSPSLLSSTISQSSSVIYAPLRTHQLTAPFSRAEFSTAARQLCVFESRGVAWRPAASLLLRAWEAVFGATDEVVPALDNDKGKDDAEWRVHVGKEVRKRVIAEAADEEQGEVFVALLPGLLRRLSRVVDKGEREEEMEVAMIEARKCVQAIGDLVAMSEIERDGDPEGGGGRAMGEAPAVVKVEKGAFLETWRKAIPSAWSGLIALEKLTVPFTEEEGTGRIRLGEKSVKQAEAVAKKPLSKWHEKLKASRKMK